MTDNNYAAQAHWGNASMYAQQAQHELEEAARALQPLGAVSEGREYAGRINDAFEHIKQAKVYADKAAAEYIASDEAWSPIPHCTLGL